MFLHMMLVLMFVHQVTSSGSGHHSLWVLASFISGDTQFPEFSGILMLDDIQVAYFDSETNRFMGNRGGEDLDPGSDGKWAMQLMFYDMKVRLDRAKQYYNLTAGGVQVQQRLTGCEVKDGEPVLMFCRDSCNGDETDTVMYNMTHFHHSSREFTWGTVTRIQRQHLFPNVYLPACVRVLKLLLDQEKNLVMRRVRPRVRLLSRQVVGGAQLTCLATDFYPRHINLTLLRDGRPVDESELIVGRVLPNGNGLYQLRKMLIIGHEELQRQHNYNCTAAHLSGDTGPEDSWRPPPRARRIQVLSVPVAMTIAIIAFIAASLLLWWCSRRRRNLRG